jgi:hypothetical protein
MGLAIDQSGNLYDADVASGSVYKFTPSAGNYAQNQVARNLARPGNVGVDESANIYLSHPAQRRLV